MEQFARQRLKDPQSEWLEYCNVARKATGLIVSHETATVAPLSPESVQPILTELVDIVTELADQKEDLIAKGVPFNTVNAIVDATKRKDLDQLENLRMTAQHASEERYGVGAIAEEELERYVERITDLTSDLMHARKMAKGMELNMFAINLLTQVIRENPADRGSQVLDDIVVAKKRRTVQGGLAANVGCVHVCPTLHEDPHNV